MKQINISSSSHNYKVIVNDNLTDLLAKFLNKQQKYFVIIDQNLVEGYQKLFLDVAPNSIFYPLIGGEDIKTLLQYNKVIDFMIENHIDRESILVCFGGGTISDLGAFVASTYLRGIKYINIPTTTLSMVDASIGGKSALNEEHLKNVIGAFYPPSLVLIGLDTLKTLSKRDFNNGLFEALKMGLITNKKLFGIFNSENYLENIEDIIIISLKEKKRIVEKDEKDNKQRKILNFGHTFGHALEMDESLNLLHGEAVANGMLIVSKDKDYFDKLKIILERMGCPIVEKVNHELLMEKIAHDKKVSLNGVSLIEVFKIGKAEIRNMSYQDFERMMENYGI